MLCTISHKSRTPKTHTQYHTSHTYTHTPYTWCAYTIHMECVISVKLYVCAQLHTISLYFLPYPCFFRGKLQRLKIVKFSGFFMTWFWSLQKRQFDGADNVTLPFLKSRLHPLKRENKKNCPTILPSWDMVT